MARRRRRRMTRKQARMRRRRIRIAGFCLAGCILILGIVCGAFHHYVSQFPEDKIAENIYVGTVDLSGLSKKEALEKLAGQKKADQKQTVSLTVEGQKAEATLEECGFDYADVKANVKAAMDYGKSGGLFGRYKSLRKLSKEKVVLSRKVLKTRVYIGSESDGEYSGRTGSSICKARTECDHYEKWKRTSD